MGTPRFFVLGILLLVGGCAPKSLIGHDAGYVKLMMGLPEDEHQWHVEEPGELRVFGPRPTGLRPGENYTLLFYKRFPEEQWFVFLASPEIFERVHGRKAGTEKECVIEVQVYEKGAVF